MTATLFCNLPMDDHHLFYILLWMITTCFTSSHEWLSLVLHLCYGWSPLVLHLLMDEGHLFYIFAMDDHHLIYIIPWMVTICFTSSYGWWPLWLTNKYSIFPPPPPSPPPKKQCYSLTPSRTTALLGSDYLQWLPIVFVLYLFQAFVACGSGINHPFWEPWAF